jgi:hypothetical protein
MKRRNQLLLGAGIAAAIAAGSVTFAMTQASANDAGTGAAKKATSSYRNIANAKAAGFGELRDNFNLACIDNQPVGGMGIHYVNVKRVGDPNEIATAPEVLVYEPQQNGKLKLVALEYVVLKADWEKAGHKAPPSLFGQEFELSPAGNRYGLPSFYELHAWVYKHNSLGMFEDWNPKVSCQFG